jgi:catabolite regulation protein CreA|tara:strand:- start:390 stop:1064 length:675 start_codon:yes stop_codon:yes gene_type:complete
MKLFGREAVLRSLVAVALTLTAPRSFAEEKTAALSTSPAPEAALPPLSSFEKTVRALWPPPAKLWPPRASPLLSTGLCVCYALTFASLSQVGEIPASGILFKDVIKVMRFKDPKVSGVELFVSEYERPLTERLARNFFSDPTQAAVTCVRTGPVTLADDIDSSTIGEEVFSQARALLFKSVKVRRLYDRESGTIIYVSYSERLNKQEDENKSRFKTSICAVNVR